jgi:hypothetical protein
MEVRPPPYPEYREQGAVPTREYRVVFWQHQLPPPVGDVPPEQMGWAELTIDLADVEDVHEAIAWAESHIDEELDKDSGEGPHGERVYVLYAKVPGEDWYIHIAGWDPVVSPEAPEANLHRKRPSRSS